MNNYKEEYNYREAKPQSTSNKLEQIIKLINDKQTPFLFHQDIELTLTKENKNLTMDEVMVKYLTNYFTLSDLFIANAIADVEYGTRDMIHRVLIYHSTKYKDKIIPTDYESLKGRLSVLTQSSIVRRFQYQTPNKKIVAFYTLTAIGYNFIKRICGFSKTYDSLASVTPVDNIVKKLAAMNIMLYFTKLHSFVDYDTNINFYQKSLGLNKLNCEIKTKVDNNWYYVLIEPIYFRYNDKRISQSEVEKEIEHRIRMVKSYFSNRTTKGMPIILFVCENKEGIIKVIKFAIKQLPNYLNRIYLTTDSVVYNNNGIHNSLINVIDTSGNISSELMCQFY